MRGYKGISFVRAGAAEEAETGDSENDAASVHTPGTSECEFDAKARSPQKTPSPVVHRRVSLDELFGDESSDEVRPPTPTHELKKKHSVMAGFAAQLKRKQDETATRPGGARAGDGDWATTTTAIKVRATFLPHTTADDIGHHFARFGDVRCVTLVGGDLAYVTFMARDAAVHAVRETPKTIDALASDIALSWQRVHEKLPRGVKYPYAPVNAARSNVRPLAPDEREYWSRLVQVVTIERESICLAMVFALERAECCAELIAVLRDAMIAPAQDVRSQLARFYLLSDILANSNTDAKFVAGFRVSALDALPAICAALGDAYRAMPGRITAVAFGDRIKAVLTAWDERHLFQDAFMARLRAAIFD